MFNVQFKVEGAPDAKIQAEAGANILDLAQQLDIAIDAPCAGNGTCGKCRVRLAGGVVEGGKGPKLSQEDYDDGWRLACASEVISDVTLWVPSNAADFKKGIQTADLSTPEELARYQDGINKIFNTGLELGVSEQGVGVAVDIGTTTVTATLMDLKTGDILGKASAGNDQIRYGADVINRIIQQSKPGGVEKLQHAVRENTIIPIVNELCAQAGVEPSAVTRCVIAGNTTMEHLLVGANGESIRLEPYVPEFLELTGKTAADLGLPFAADAPVILAPNVGSYVGGDITAGVLANLMWTRPEMTFFIDLGTNGELVFGNEEVLLTCACSAGPAFEGGDISCGMRATKGAIQAAKIDPDTMEPTFDVVGGGKPIGMCGSGIIDVIAELFRGGIINAKGKFSKEGSRVRHMEYGASEFILATEEESADGSEVVINETDIDNFIRAKGAIFSGFMSLLGSMGMDLDCVDHVVIAGGIGAGINMANAISIGMLPKIPLEKYSYIGNSSLTGACAMLLSDQATDKCFEVGRNMTYIELSTEPSYMDEFVAACFLPHTNAALFE